MKPEIPVLSGGTFTLMLHRAGGNYERSVPSIPLLNYMLSIEEARKGEPGTHEFLYTGMYHVSGLTSVTDREEYGHLRPLMYGGKVILSGSSAVSQAVESGLKTMRKFPKWLDTIVVDWATEVEDIDSVHREDWVLYTERLSAAVRKGLRVVVNVRVPSNFWSLSTLPRPVQEWGFLADQIVVVRGMETDPEGEPELYMQKENRLKFA